MKTQLVELKVTKTLKGKSEGLISVHGHESGICKPQYYFKGNAGDIYFLYLRKGNDGTYHVVNIGAHHLPVKGEITKHQQEVIANFFKQVNLAIKNSNSRKK